MKPFFMDVNSILDFEREKEAAHKLPKESEKWPEAITDILYATHPWLEAQSVEIKINPKDDEKGMAIGSVVVDKKYLIPIIVNDFKLEPLDIYFSGSKKKPLNKKSFSEELRGSSIGKVKEQRPGDIMDQSLWSNTRLPYQYGRTSFASGIDPDDAKEMLEDAFNASQLHYVLRSNPEYKQVISEMVSSKQVKVASNSQAEWELVEPISFDKNPVNNVHYVYSSFDKIACLIGKGLINPATGNEIDDYFGIEANTKDPRYFMSHGLSEIVTDTVKEAELGNLNIFTKEASDQGWAAYLVPCGNVFKMVGPFISYGYEDGVEKVYTSELCKIAQVSDYDVPYEKIGDLLLVGKGSIKISLGEMFDPKLQTNEESLKVASLLLDGGVEVNTIGDSITGWQPFTSEIPACSFDNFIKELEKTGAVLGDLRKKLFSKLSKHGKAYLKKKGSVPTTENLKQDQQYASYETSGTVSPEIKDRKLIDKKKRKQLCKAAAFIHPTTLTTIGMNDKLELVKQSANVDSESTRKTVDAILSLNFLNDVNKDKFYNNIDKLEEARDICVELLISSRLGLDINPTPLKLAMEALDSSIRELRQQKMLDASK